MVMSGNLSENWKFWKQRFNTYLKATEICKKDESTKCAQLLTLIGDEGIRIYNTFTWNPDEEETLESLQEKFDAHLNPKKNLSFERHKFFTYRQAEGQTIEQFITELKNLSLSCEFGNLRESLVRDILICGIRSTFLREKLLQEDIATLEKAVQTCNNFESTRKQNRQISNGLGKENEVELVSFKSSSNSSKSTFNRAPNKSGVRRWKTNSKPCRKCSKQHEFGQCPAFGKKCYSCGVINHFSNSCTNKSLNKNIHNKGKYVNVLNKSDNSSENSSDNENLFFVGTVHASSASREINAVSEASWEVVLEIHKNQLRFKLDTGAMANIIPVSYLNQMNFNFNHIQKTRTKLTSYTKHNIQVLGQVDLICKYKSKEVNLLFYVVNSECSPILGLKACKDLELIKRIEPINKSESNSNLNNILEKFNSVFEGMGCLEKEYHIELKDNIKPTINYPRKIPLALRDKLKSTLDQLEKQNLIKKSNDSTDWCHNMVIVRKPNGQLRIALDPKELNESIKRHFFQIPTLEELTSKLAGAKYFSVLDATQGFLQVKLDKESSKLCTFATPFGRYQFLRLPYGICSAPEVFQEKMFEIFGSVEGCCFYIDDLLIYGNSVEQHNERLEKILNIAKESNLKFNSEKCKFLVSEVKYMGHIITSEGMKADDSKVQAIRDMPIPKDKKDVQRFLGMITYMSKFVDNLSEKTVPLRNLLKKDSIFQWTENQDKAFSELKKSLSEAPCLNYYDVKKDQATISVDSSQYGMAAVLLQDGKPCAHASRALTETQCRYAQIEKEMLSVWFGITRFSQYIYMV